MNKKWFDTIAKAITHHVYYSNTHPQPSLNQAFRLDSFGGQAE
jgi:hypothetical protein